MYIELIRKTCLWYGDRGVGMNIKARTQSLYTTVNPLLDKGEDVEIDISISGLGEVSATVPRSNPLSCGYDISADRPLTGDAMWYVHKWLDSTGLMSEWKEETVKYLGALSRVDLPFPPRDTDGSSGYLSYCIKLGHESRALTLGVRVYETVTAISVRYMDDAHKYEGSDYIDFGESIVSGPITIDTLRVAAMRVIDGLFDMVSLPIVERNEVHVYKYTF